MINTNKIVNNILKSRKVRKLKQEDIFLTGRKIIEVRNLTKYECTKLNFKYDVMHPIKVLVLDNKTRVFAITDNQMSGPGKLVHMDFNYNVINV